MGKVKNTEFQFLYLDFYSDTYSTVSEYLYLIYNCKVYPIMFLLFTFELCIDFFLPHLFSLSLLRLTIYNKYLIQHSKWRKLSELRLKNIIFILSYFTLTVWRRSHIVLPGCLFAIF